MHSPHFTHAARNRGSGSAPGGRISFSGALLVVDMRNSGTTSQAERPGENPPAPGRVNPPSASPARSEIGKLMAAVGQRTEQE